jgi:uncharacterized glyoxalase superfamily protein PhnB
MPNGFRLEFDSVAFAERWGTPAPTGSMGVLGFSLASRDDVDRRYGELTGAGYRGRKPPHDAFWGARYAILEDPDGNGVGLMSPIDPEHRSAPPEL